MEIDEIKIEFNDVHESPMEHEVPAQALMTLHDSVQNMPSKQKSALQEAVADASPIKRPRLEGLQDNQPWNQYSPLKRYEPRSLSKDFSQEQLESMNKNYTSIKNTLKQSSGRRWAYYEFFYSNIDRALLLGCNDFEICLKQMFQDLKTRMLTRRQWSNIRRLMGKPRRYSAAFLKEERAILEEKRKKIRYLHQLKGFEVTDMTQFKDLPEEVPTPMVIGTKVTAKVPDYLQKDGLNLFTGSIDAVDNVNNTFRIIFDREGIGSHSIPDTDVSSEEYESMNLQLFVVKERPKVAESTNQKVDKSDANCSPTRLRLKEELRKGSGGTFGGFPVHFLLQLTTLSKAIALKKEYVKKLKEMNSKVELAQPFGYIKKDFQRDYAFVVLELDKINTEMNDIFDNIQHYIHTDAPHMGALDQSLNVRNECNEKAMDLIEQSQCILHDEHMLTLTKQFTSLMLQINHVAESEEPCSAKLSLLDSAVEEIKETLHPSNKKLFEDQVEISIAFLKNNLQNEKSSLSAFSHKKQQENLLPLVDNLDDNLSSNDENDNDDDDDDLLLEEEEEEEIKEEDSDLSE
ncbi:protein lin-9 homolog [Clytia hemisphaerica]|uniref:DIRP domain-containing protein n=1 Tax=Clytia hemisphaerica TaxID=252671 RepID=A0A7M5V2J8_9CNID